MVSSLKVIESIKKVKEKYVLAINDFFGGGLCVTSVCGVIDCGELHSER
jgi:hypothetical protein